MRTLSLVLLAGMLTAEPVHLPEPYQSLVDLAQAAPPEFAADALLRIVESGKITDRGAKHDLVEQAFQLAATANFTVRMRGVAGTTTDTRSGFLSRAYDLKLDALSLQTRAVRDMLAIDAARARALFQDIPKPVLAPLTCDDPLVYDVSPFYETLAAVANSSFSDKERAKDDDLNFVLDYLGQASSAAQLEPLARALAIIAATPEHSEVIWNRFSGLLETLQADPRSYSATVNSLGTEVDPRSRASFEKYKAANNGCPQDSSEKNAANHTPKVQPYWQSDTAKQLLADGLRLRSTADGHIYTDAERATPQWQARLTDYLSELAGWTSSQELSEADYYNQKCIVFQALVELIPPGAQRDKILMDYVDFISNSNLQQQTPVEWFAQAHSMLERVRGTNTGEFAKLSELFQHSGNPVLALEVALEQVLGGKQPGGSEN